mmetsp:Transcript_127510/g.408112  ORF Transcript_127510/g.408112 Transcript_127510/m.408112 type:complete len:244 (-) Transcript_127510:409-1140(-)
MRCQPLLDHTPLELVALEGELRELAGLVVVARHRRSSCSEWLPRASTAMKTRRSSLFLLGFRIGMIPVAVAAFTRLMCHSSSRHYSEAKAAKGSCCEAEASEGKRSACCVSTEFGEVVACRLKCISFVQLGQCFCRPPAIWMRLQQAFEQPVERWVSGDTRCVLATQWTSFASSSGLLHPRPEARAAKTVHARLHACRTVQHFLADHASRALEEVSCRGLAIGLRAPPLRSGLGPPEEEGDGG